MVSSARSLPRPTARQAHASKRVRLSSADRRASIVAAAKSIFATDGYEGAKTIKIANAAGVSEALVYRHFPSKEALYRAVLRHVVREQDENMAEFSRIEPSGLGLLMSIVHSIDRVLQSEGATNTEGMRLVFGSIAGDGSYARLIYRRAQRLIREQIRAALEAASADGDLVHTPLTPENVINFVEHVTSMIQLTRRGENPIIEYAGDRQALALEAVRFCARGIGLRHDFVEKALAELPEFQPRTAAD